MIKESCKPVASTFIIDAEVHSCFLPYNNFYLLLLVNLLLFHPNFMVFVPFRLLALIEKMDVGLCLSRSYLHVGEEARIL